MRSLHWTDHEVYLVAERAHSLHLQGHYREAGVLFQGLAAVDPENQYCIESLAATWLALGEPERAIESLNILLDRQSGDLAVRARRMEAYLRAGDLAAAARDFEFLHHLLPAHQVRRLELSMEAVRRADITDD